MFKSTKEFDSAIKEILVAICNGERINSIKTTLQIDDFNEALVECIDRKYLSGASYRRTEDGTPHFQGENIRVSYSGLSFLESK